MPKGIYERTGYASKVRAEAKAKTRAKLIAAARKLWAEPGTYEAVGIREIAAEMSMSTGAVFSHVASKADLWRIAMGYEPPVDGPEVRKLLRAAAGREAAAAFIASREAA